MATWVSWAHVDDHIADSNLGSTLLHILRYDIGLGRYQVHLLLELLQVILVRVPLFGMATLLGGIA